MAIKRFKCPETEALFHGRRVARRGTIERAALRKPEQPGWSLALDDLRVPPQRIGDIVAGKRAITADTDLRRCRYFGLGDGWWLRRQANYDKASARETMGEALARIPRCSRLAA